MIAGIVITRVVRVREALHDVEGRGVEVEAIAAPGLATVLRIQESARSVERLSF